MLTGRRVVLGVSGGIAAYKAVEVCRRLVDAGAHVVPVMTKGAEHFLGRATLTRARQRTRADGAVRRARADPAHQARTVGRSDRRRPGDGPGHRGLCPRAFDRPAHQHAARVTGTRRDLPGDAFGDVGAPGGRRQHRAPSPSRGAHRGARRPVVSPGATSAPAVSPRRPTSSPRPNGCSARAIWLARGSS